MTNEEAITTLTMMRVQIEWDYPMEYAVAIDMAIEALRSATDINVATKEPEIIHCRDCKHWEGEYINGFWYFEECSLNWCRAFSDDFCSWAEGRQE